MAVNFNSTIQFWGAGSGLTQIGDMIDALLMKDNLKIKDLENKKTDNNKIMNIWDKLNTNFNSLKNILNDLKNIDKNKKISFSKEGYFLFSTSGNIANNNYTIKVEKLATSHKIYSNKITDTIGVTGSFQINGINIDVTDTDTIETLAEKIKTNINSVNTYIIDKRLIIESKNTGIGSNIMVSDTDGILKNIGIINSDNTLNELTKPENAVVYINGIRVESENNELNNIIDGVNLKLLQPTNENITVSISNDIDTIVSKIKSLIDNINNILKDINSNTSKGATLQGNSILNRLKSEVIGILQTSFGQNNVHLFEMGISIDRYSNFTLDETKLKDFVQNNISKLNDILNNADNGLVKKINDYLNNRVLNTKGIINSAKERINNENTYIDKEIKRQQEFIEKKKALLTKQFTAMEKIISQLKGQQTYITSAFNNNKND